MKAVTYVRVSTEGQATEGVSLSAQRARIEAWCAANGAEVVGAFVDAGLSGKRADNRPGLQSAIALACREHAAVVVFSLSRLARSVQDTLRISAQLEKFGADLVSLSEKIDTTSAAGKLVFRMFAVLAEFERDLCSERTKAALAHKKQRGEVIGAVPFGWRREGAKLVAIPEAQDALAFIIQRRGSGAPYAAIAKELVARGVPSAQGGKWAARTVWGVVRRAAA
jgi:site-specific DNA recombinase